MSKVNLKIYKLYDDLKLFNNKQLFNHLNKYGKKEKRLISENQFIQKYPKFDWKLYLDFNKDLQNKLNTKEECMMHYWINGDNENRIFGDIIILYINQNIINKNILNLINIVKILNKNKKFIVIYLIINNNTVINLTDDEKNIMYTNKFIKIYNKNININNKYKYIYVNITDEYDCKSNKTIIPTICYNNKENINTFGKNYPGLLKKDYDEKELLNILDYLYYKLKYNYKFIFNFVTKKRVLFLSNDIIWNTYVGNSIWASNFIKIISKYNNIDLSVLVSRYCKNKNTTNIFKKELNNVDFIDIPNILKKNITSFNNCCILNNRTLVKYLIDNINNYDYIIIRGVHIIELLLSYLKARHKTLSLNFNKIIYIQMNKARELEYIKKFKNKIHMTFLEYFNNKKKNKYIIPPLLFNNTKIIIPNKYKYDYCYVGSFHQDSNLEQVLQVFSMTENINKKIILSGKYTKETFNIYSVINKYKKYKNIIIDITEEGITREQSEVLIQQSKYCIRFDELHECLSSKLLNYIFFEKICIIQRTKTHEYIFGKKYDFFTSSCHPIKVIELKNLIKKTNNDILYNRSLKLIKQIKNKLDPFNLIKNNYKL